jgi:hypothetical protein
MINGCLSRERRAGLTAAGRKAVGKLRRLTLLAVPVMFGVAAWPAWSLDVVYAESNSAAGNSILSFENDGTGALHFLGSTRTRIRIRMGI